MTCPRLFAWSAGTLQHSARWRSKLCVVAGPRSGVKHKRTVSTSRWTLKIPWSHSAPAQNTPAAGSTHALINLLCCCPPRHTPQDNPRSLNGSCGVPHGCVFRPAKSAPEVQSAGAAFARIDGCVVVQAQPRPTRRRCVLRQCPRCNQPTHARSASSAEGGRSISIRRSFFQTSDGREAYRSRRRAR